MVGREEAIVSVMRLPCRTAFSLYIVRRSTIVVRIYAVAFGSAGHRLLLCSFLPPVVRRPVNNSCESCNTATAHRVATCSSIWTIPLCCAPIFLATLHCSLFFLFFFWGADDEPDGIRVLRHTHSTSPCSVPLDPWWTL